MIAPNAQEILDARLQGLKPAEMILVSLVGTLREVNHTVLASPHEVYDWRWVRGLDICVYIDAKVEWRRTVLALAHCCPGQLFLWDITSRRGANVYLKPSHPASEARDARSWKWILDFSSWFECENEAYRA